MALTDLRDLQLEEMTALLESAGEASFRARQVCHWVYKRQVTDVEQMTDLPEPLRQCLRQQFYVSTLTLLRQQQSSDGVLATNGTLRASVRSLTEVMLKDVESLVGSGFSRAANAGVSLDRDGKLTLDVAALTSALENSPNDVKALFGAVGDSMYQASNSIAAAFSGTVASQIRFLTESNEALELRIDDVEQRLELRRESLIRQYTRMETMLTQIQSQGSWLTQQIQSLEPSNT